MGTLRCAHSIKLPRFENLRTAVETSGPLPGACFAHPTDSSVGCGERGRSFKMAPPGGANRIDNVVGATNRIAGVGLTRIEHGKIDAVPELVSSRP